MANLAPSTFYSTSCVSDEPTARGKADAKSLRRVTSKMNEIRSDVERKNELIAKLKRKINECRNSNELELLRMKLEVEELKLRNKIHSTMMEQRRSRVEKWEPISVANADDL
jgi:hypothetical protein